MNSSRQPNFDPIARSYRWLEYFTFGPCLERTRFHFLPQLIHHRRALILGDGDGRFTARLLATNPAITIDAIDSSATMLQLLNEHAAKIGPSAQDRLQTIHTDALTFTPEGEYDLIVTHFFLDCFTESELEPLLTRLRPHLAPNAAWLISDFAIPKTQPAAAISQSLIFLLYLAFRIFTGLKTHRLPDYATLPRQTGFSLTQKEPFLEGLLVSELWQLDESL